ncbi:MAG: hypothetical protein WB696_29080 [Chthoniobacterales bacterium]
MNLTADKTIKRVMVALRVFFVAAAVLSAIAGIQLYSLPDYTDHYCTWTIKQPLSATFLGTSFWGWYLLGSLCCS